MSPGAPLGATPVLAVLRPGLLTTVQDLGRPDAAALGVPPSGACDPLALAAANLLVGNHPGAAALEVSLLGPELRTLRACLVAVTGADFEASLESGTLLRPGRAYALEPGTALRMGTAVDGARGYLAIRGGIAVPPILGSASTALGAGFGGLEGRALREGDRIAAYAPAADAPPAGPRGWPGPGPSSGVPSAAGRAVELRVLRGPHADALGPAAWTRLVGTTWEVDSRSDRMGVRLIAPYGADAPLVLGEDPLLVSLPVIWGAIQLPPGGAPICLLADHPTVGGYPVVASVASIDFPILGQLRPPHRVRFRPIDLVDAQAAILRSQDALREAARRLTRPPVWATERG